MLFADHIKIIANEHNYKDIHIPVSKQGCHAEQIEIGEGSWIGIDAKILNGTKIGKNCVVGAGSVVKGSFPDYSVIAGCPARIIKKYNIEEEIWK